MLRRSTWTTTRWWHSATRSCCLVFAVLVVAANGQGNGTSGGDTECTIVGPSLVCPNSTTLTFNGAEKVVDTSISCPLDFVSQSNFVNAASTLGVCGCDLLSVSLGDGLPQARDDCECFTCPQGSPTSTAFLCREQSLLGPCFNFTCTGECNGDMSSLFSADSGIGDIGGGDIEVGSGGDVGIADCPGAESIALNELVSGTFNMTGPTAEIPGVVDNIFDSGSKQSLTVVPSCGMATDGGGFGSNSSDFGFGDIGDVNDLLGGFDDLFGDLFGDSGSGIGHWYTIMGTGQPLRATTCHGGTATPASLVVMDGSCDFLFCVVGDVGTASCDQGSAAALSSTAATVTWISELDTMYFIRVSPHENFETVTDAELAVYELSVTEFVAVDNDNCTNAIEIVLPDRSSPSSSANETTGNTTSGATSSPTVVAFGSTWNATKTFDYNEYCGAPLEYPGTWYKLVGRGSGKTGE